LRRFIRPVLGEGKKNRGSQMGKACSRPANDRGGESAGGNELNHIVPNRVLHKITTEPNRFYGVVPKRFVGGGVNSRPGGGGILEKRLIRERVATGDHNVDNKAKPRKEGSTRGWQKKGKRKKKTLANVSGCFEGNRLTKIIRKKKKCKKSGGR